MVINFIRLAQGARDVVSTSETVRKCICKAMKFGILFVNIQGQLKILLLVSKFFPNTINFFFLLNLFAVIEWRVYECRMKKALSKGISMQKVYCIWRCMIGEWLRTHRGPQVLPTFVLFFEIYEEFFFLLMQLLAYIKKSLLSNRVRQVSKVSFGCSYSLTHQYVALRCSMKECFQIEDL